MADYDALVIGAGHNGLVAALYLARAGWKVLVLERDELIGGAVRSGELTHPGFIHDYFSTNQNLFRASPVFKELGGELARKGLHYRVTDRPYANLFPEGKSLRVYRNLAKTRAAIAEHDPAEADNWSALYWRFQDFKQALLPLYFLPMPSADALLALAKGTKDVGISRMVELVQTVLSSTRELAEVSFQTKEMRTLLATWGLHLDFGPDVSGGTMFPYLETFSDMEEGQAVAEGGASHLVEALAELLAEQGGEVRTQAEVRRILVEGGRAVGVELTSGERITAGRAVIANLTPNLIFDHLLADEPLPGEFRRKVRGYRFGPATMMVHLALDGKAPWRGDEELGRFGYVHIAPYMEDLSRTYSQSLNGYLPDSPLLVVGQTSAIDPTRTPAGKEILWVQVRTLPGRILGDAAGAIEARTWEEAKEPFADRVMQKLESYAPGLSRRVLGRVVFSPQDLERFNPNLKEGDSLAGSHHLRQNFLWRPFPGWSNYQMPLDGLYAVGASTWPGAGTNATSGYLAAQRLLHAHGRRNRFLLGGAVAATAGVAALVAREKLTSPTEKR